MRRSGRMRKGKVYHVENDLGLDHRRIERLMTEYTHTHVCKRCLGVWTTPLPFPKRCRWCRSELWNKDRVRAPGGGRPPQDEKKEIRDEHSVR